MKTTIKQNIHLNAILRIKNLDLIVLNYLIKTVQIIKKLMILQKIILKNKTKTSIGLHPHHQNFKMILIKCDKLYIGRVKDPTWINFLNKKKKLIRKNQMIKMTKKILLILKY